MSGTMLNEEVCHIMYGGNLDNRIRFAIEVVEGIRKACGKDFCIILRIAPCDFIPVLGLSKKHVKYIIDKLILAGVDLIDLTGGIDPRNKKSMCVEPQGFSEAFRAMPAKEIKDTIKVPVSTVGVLRSPSVCNDLIKNNVVDFVTLGRALIADPHWVKKAKNNDFRSIRPCISCNDGCFSTIINDEHKPITCALNPIISREDEYSNIPLAQTKKTIVIIGSGPAGLQSALTSSDRGHNVILIEKDNKLGGQLNIACVSKGKKFIKNALDWYKYEISKSNVKTMLNTTADLTLIKSLTPDHIIMCTGSIPLIPNIVGINKSIRYSDILNGNFKVDRNKNIVVIGGGIIGAEVGLYLCNSENKVTILEMGDTIADKLEKYNRITLIRHLKENKVKCITSSKVIEINKSYVTYEKNCKLTKIKTDYTILALGQKSFGADLLAEIKKENISVFCVGDMVNVDNIASATEQAFLTCVIL